MEIGVVERNNNNNEILLVAESGVDAESANDI